MADVQILLDERGVCDALYRFAEGIDLRDWGLYRSAFTDELTFDYTSHRPGSVGVVPADDWVARARRRFETLDATQHTMSNPRMTVFGDTAVCAMYVEAWHSVAVEGVDRHCTIGGRYVHDLERAGDEWRISVLRLQVRWSQGDRTILDL
ncbi:MAG: nuclear transport factor 2 family protein [Actinobacteria bacterium]|nr:nuclear transport factor 2 family protein [Actinomycetota bacterium]